MLTCPSCNAQMPEGSIVCAYCGTRLAAPEALLQNTPEALQQNAPENVRPLTDPASAVHAEREREAYGPGSEPDPVADALKDVLARKPGSAADETPAAGASQTSAPYAPCAPQPEYVQPNAPRFDPAQPYAQQPWPAAEEQPAQPLPAKQKKKKTGKLLLIGGAALLLVAAIVGAVLFFVLRAKKEALPKALEKTNAQYVQYCEAGSQPNGAGNALSALREQHRYSIDFDLDVSLDLKRMGDETAFPGLQFMPDHFLLVGTEDVEGSTQSGALTLDANQGSSLTLRFAGDGTQYQFSVDGVDGVYAFDAEELGAAGEGLNSLLTGQSDGTAAEDSPGAQLLKGITGKQSGSYQIATDGGDKKADRYSASWPTPETGADASPLSYLRLLADRENLLGNLLWLLSGPNGSFESHAEFYVCDGAVVGVDLYAKDSDDVIYLRLLGADNIWDHVRLNSTGSDAVLEILRTEDGGTRMTLTQRGETTEPMRYDPNSGAFRFDMTGLGTPLTLDGTVHAKGEGMELTLSLRSSGIDGAAAFTADATLAFTPLRNSPSLLTDTPIDFSLLTEEEQQALGSELLVRLMALAGPAPETPDEPTDEPTDGPETDYRPTEAELVGDYRFDHVEYLGMQLSPEMIGVSSEWELTLNADGSATITLGSDTAAGVWTLIADEVWFDEGSIDEMMLTARPDGTLCYVDDEALEGMQIIFVRADATGTETPEPTDRPMETPDAAELPGRYVLDHVSYDGMELPLSMFGDMLDWELTLAEDGGTEISFGDERAPGTWTLEGDSIVLRDGDEIVMELGYRDGMLIYGYEDEDVGRMEMCFARSED